MVGRVLILIRGNLWFHLVSLSISVIVIHEIRYALVTISLAILTHMPLPLLTQNYERFNVSRTQLSFNPESLNSFSRINS